MIMTKEINP